MKTLILNRSPEASVADKWMFRVDGWGTALLHFDLKRSIENLMQVVKKRSSLVEEYERVGLNVKPGLSISIS